MDPVKIELLNALSQLYRSGKYSDLTVICNAARYKVHKALLCSRSRFFDAACSSEFMESRNGEIDLSEEDAEVVAHLIDYFYYLNYDMDDQEVPKTNGTSAQPSAVKAKSSVASHPTDPLLAMASTISPPLSRSSSPNEAAANNAEQTPRLLSRRQMQLQQQQRARTSSSSSGRESPPPLTPTSRETDHSEPDDMDVSDDAGSVDEEEPATPRLLLHARLYSAAEKYGIVGLKMLAKHKFETRLFPSAQAFDASPLGSQESREAFLVEELPAAIEEVYTGTVDTDRGLRNAVLQAFRAHPEWGRRREIIEVIREHGTLGFDLYRLSNAGPIR